MRKIESVRFSQLFKTMLLRTICSLNTIETAGSTTYIFSTTFLLCIPHFRYVLTGKTIERRKKCAWLWE